MRLASMLFLLVFLVVKLTYGAPTTAAAAAADDDGGWWLDCRRCKVYVRANVGGAPENSSSGSGKKPNVGAVVGFTFLLVFVLLLIFMCIYRNRKSASRAITISMVLPGVPRDGIVPQQLVLEDKRQGQRAVGRRDRKKQGQGQPGKKRPQDEYVKGQQQRDEDRNKGKQKQQQPRQQQQQQPRVEEVVKAKKRDRDGKQQQPPSDEDVERQCKEGREGKQPIYQDNNVGGQHGKGVKKKERPKKATVGDGNQLQKFTYPHLEHITNSFNKANKIGGVGFGVVYKATLIDETEVAVKCFKFGGMIDDFKNEVEALGRADHSNLVKLIGYCDEGITRILVYEYMRKGSLDKWIFHTDPKKTLTWPEMKKIIRGIAKGLVYLHEKCEKKILHRDLKPSNVVLDEKKNAKVCDFGLAKLIDKSQTSTSTLEGGSSGYKAPEIWKNKRITEKIDVYSFGIVVLEIVFGKRYHHLVTSDKYSQTEEVKLHDLIKSLSEEMQRNGEEIIKIGEIAVSCLSENPKNRPSMSVVLADLQGLKAKVRRN